MQEKLQDIPNMFFRTALSLISASVLLFARLLWTKSPLIFLMRDLAVASFEVVIFPKILEFCTPSHFSFKP